MSMYAMIWRRIPARGRIQRVSGTLQHLPAEQRFSGIRRIPASQVADNLRIDVSWFLELDEKLGLFRKTLYVSFAPCQ